MGPGRKAWRILSTGTSRPGVFEESLLPHVDALYGLAMRLTRDADAAADLLQDTVVRALERFHQLRKPNAARAWFVRILTTTFLNRYAGRIWVNPPATEAEPVFEETPEGALLRRRDAEEVEAALAELRDDFRLTLLLADVEELPLREIAAICRCPVGTVASRLARGRQALRARLRHLRVARTEDA